MLQFKMWVYSDPIGSETIFLTSYTFNFYRCVKEFDFKIT